MFAQTSNFNKAKELFEKAIIIKPDYAMVYNNLGAVYKSKKNYLKAETYFER